MLGELIKCPINEPHAVPLVVFAKFLKFSNSNLFIFIFYDLYIIYILIRIF